MRGYHNNIKKTSLKDVPNKMFNSIFHKPLGQDIYGFLRLELTIIRMIDAANLGRASVDPICDDIYKSFQYEFEKMTSGEKMTCNYTSNQGSETHVWTFNSVDGVDALYSAGKKMTGLGFTVEILRFDLIMEKN